MLDATPKISFAISKLGIAAVADCSTLPRWQSPRIPTVTVIASAPIAQRIMVYFFLYAANFLPMLAIYAATRRIEHPPKERPARTGLAPA